MSIPIENVYYLLCYAWGHMDESDVVDASSLDRFDQLQDLFGKVLAEGTFRLLRRGLDRGYYEVTRELAGVRGKLKVGLMAKRALRAKGRTACTYEELSHDVLHNQILRSTLATFLSLDELDKDVREEVGLAHRKLEGIREVRISKKLFRQVQLDRNMRMYRFLLSLCELIHESVLVDRESGGYRFRDFREKKDMWRLFEDFVREFYRRESRYGVGGRRIPWYDARAVLEEDLARVPAMEADIVLDGLGRRIILDTKFYAEAFGGRYEAKKLHSSNLYQLLNYLRNRQAAEPDGPRHEGILLYPVVDSSFKVDVVLNDFRVQARSVDLGQPWRRIHEELLEIVAS